MNSIIGVPKEEWRIYESADTLCKGKRESCGEGLTDEKLTEIINEVANLFESQVNY